MCMNYCKTERPKGQYTRAWKVLEWDCFDNCWVTPYRHTQCTQTLTARGAVIFETNYLSGSNVLTGGAIHCFRDRELAKEEAAYLRYWEGDIFDVFEVRGRGHVGHNGDEIAFRQVTFVDQLDEWYIPKGKL